MALSAARIAKLFAVTITRTLAADALNEAEDTAFALALDAGRTILESKGDDKPAEVHEMVDGFIVSGQKSAVLMGNDGAVKYLSAKGTTTTTEDADETLIGSWKGKACDNDTFNKAVKGITPSLGTEGDLNFIKYAGKDGNMVGVSVTGKDGANKYFIPMQKAAESVVDPVVLPAASAGVKQAIAFLKMGKTTEAAVSLGKVQERLKGAIPRKLKESASVAASLTEAASLMESAPEEANAMIHEAYMAVMADQGPYDPDAPFAIYGSSINFRPDTYIAKTPDYSVACFVVNLAVKEVMKGPLGSQLAKAVAVALKASKKVEALDIELREMKFNESIEEGTQALHEDDANTYSAEQLRERIATLHEYVNKTLADKLGPDDDASTFLGGNRNSQYKDYIDCRFQLGQKLERDENGGIGKWVTDAGHSQGGGVGNGDAKGIKEMVQFVTTLEEAANIPAHKVHVATRGTGKHVVAVRTGDSLGSKHKHWSGTKWGDEAKEYPNKADAAKAARTARTHYKVGKNAAGENIHVEDMTEAEKGLFPGEGNGTVSPYAGKDDDGDEDEDGDGNDPDETVAVVIPGDKGLELHKGYNGTGALLAKEDCDATDDDDAKEALGRLAQKAQSLGYVYVPANMKEDEHYLALSMVLAPMIETPAQLQGCATWIEAFEAAVKDDDAGAALSAAQAIAEKQGKEIPVGLVEGLSARAHKPGRRPLIKSRFKLKTFGKPKGKTGPGSSGQHTNAPAAKPGIKVHEDAGKPLPGGGDGKVSRTGKAGDTFNAPSAPLKNTGPGAGTSGNFSKAPTDGAKGVNIVKGKGKGVDETDDHEQCKAGDFVSYNGDPHVITGIGKDGKTGSIVPVKLEKDGAWGKTGAEINANTSEMNFLKKGKNNTSESRKHAGCPECKGTEVVETTGGMKCEGCGYSASKSKFLVEIDTNQEGTPKLNTASIKKPKTPGPQNLIPQGNVPGKGVGEGTSADQMSKQCACPNCENTADIDVSGKTVTCGNCGYTGGPADFQLPSGVGDTVEAWIGKVRDMSVEDFVADIGTRATTETAEVFSERIDAVVEAWKTGPKRKNMARKITAANPLVKRKLGKGVDLESVKESLDDHKNLRFTFPKADADRFLLATREAGANGDEGSIDMQESEIIAILPRDIGDKVRALFNGDGITVEAIA